jgi:hypothetical protein
MSVPAVEIGPKSVQKAVFIIVCNILSQVLYSHISVILLVTIYFLAQNLRFRVP